MSLFFSSGKIFIPGHALSRVFKVRISSVFCGVPTIGSYHVGFYIRRHFLSPALMCPAFLLNPKPMTLS